MTGDNKERFFPGFFRTPVFLRLLRKTAIILLVALAAFTGIGVFIGYYFEDTVKNIIITGLNKNLTTRIEVEDIEFSILKKFPYATVHFINAVVYDPRVVDTVKNTAARHKKKFTKKLHDNDTILLKAKDIYLQFSLLDMLFGEYKMQKIEVSDARLKLKVFRDGTDNYHIWRSSPDTVQKKEFSFDLQHLRLKNVAASYINIKNREDFRVYARDLSLRGKFREKKYELNIDGDAYVHQIMVEGTDYFSAKNTEIDLTLNVDESTETYTFTKGNLYIGRMSLAVAGFVTTADRNEQIGLKIEGKDLPLQSFIEELPGIIRRHMEDYRGKGEFNFIAEVKGSIRSGDKPTFSASFTLKDGEIIQKKSNVMLEKVSLNASYTSGNKQSAVTSVLRISEFSAYLREGHISGKFSMSNFNRPEIELAAKANFDLGAVHEFIRSDTILAMSGSVDLDLKYKGTLTNPGNFSAADFINSTSSGKLALNGGSFEFRNNKLILTGLNGNFVFNNSDVIAENFTGHIGSTDFSIKGYFRNVISFLVLKDESLQVDASFTSNHLNIDDLLQSSLTPADTLYRFEISRHLDLSLDLNIRNLVFEKFQAMNISGQIKIRNEQLLARNIVLFAMGGRTTATGLIDASQDGRFLVTCDASINKVDISRMFYQLNNFGQNKMREDNLKGALTATIQFGSVWSSDLKPDLSTVYAKADIKIEDGELINYEPIKGLSKHFKDRDFSHVKFSTLTTHIEIKEKVINIPKTEINSDAVNFSVYGTHGFDDKIDYHLSMLFSEFKRPTPINENEFGVIEDDGTGKIKYFCRITGTTEKPVYEALDKQAYKEQIATNLKTEKENLRDILNKEFGWFKKDTVNKKDKKPELKKEKKSILEKDKENKEQEFQIEWEEDELDKPK